MLLREEAAIELRSAGVARTRVTPSSSSSLPPPHYCLADSHSFGLLPTTIYFRSGMLPCCHVMLLKHPRLTAQMRKPLTFPSKPVLRRFPILYRVIIMATVMSRALVPVGTSTAYIAARSCLQSTTSNPILAIHPYTPTTRSFCSCKSISTVLARVALSKYVLWLHLNPCCRLPPHVLPSPQRKKLGLDHGATPVRVSRPRSATTQPVERTTYNPTTSLRPYKQTVFCHRFPSVVIIRCLERE